MALDINDQMRAGPDKATLEGILRAAPGGAHLRSGHHLGQRELWSDADYDHQELLGQSACLLYPSQEEYERVGREKYLDIARDGVKGLDTSMGAQRDVRVLDVYLRLVPSVPVHLYDLAAGVDLHRPGHNRL